MPMSIQYNTDFVNQLNYVSPVQKNTSPACLMRATMRGYNFKILIDSGASRSCCSLKFAQHIQMNFSPLEEGDPKTLLTATDVEMNMVGKTTAILDLPCNRKLHVPCYIVDGLGQNMIIGNEFLHKSASVVDYANQQISFYRGQIIVKLFESSLAAPILRVATVVELLPNHQTLVPVTLSRYADNEVGFIEPIQLQQNQKFVVAKTLVKPQGLNTMCLVANISAEKIHLRKGRHLATLENIDSDESIQVITETDDFHLNRQPHQKADPNTSRFVHQQVPTNRNQPEQEGPKYTFEELGIKLEQPDLTPEDRQKFVNLINEFGDCFAKNLMDLKGTRTVTHKIDTGDAAPIRRKPYKCSPEAQKEIERQVQEMYEADIITPSVSVWANPILLVRKSNGEMRFCIDYRALNKVTKKVSCVMPSIDDAMTAVTNANTTVMSLIDMRSGYFQQHLDSEESMDRSTFVSANQAWKFKRTSFGLLGAPSSFQLLMNIILQGLTMKTCLAYLDDILVFSPTIDQHIEDLREIFLRFRQHGIKAHPQKTHIGLSKLSYLGYTLSAKGLEVDPGRIQKVKDYPRPTNLKELRSYLGYCGFTRKHIAGFSRICAPLYELMKNDAPWVWTDRQEQAFITLREKISSPPILAMPNVNKKFKIYTDASGTTLAWILAQDGDDGMEHTIAVGSKALRGAQLKYAISELECMAMVEALRANRHLLSNEHKHDIYVDHIALTYIRGLKFATNPRLYRMALFLDSFNFDVKFKKGIDNKQADALSRVPCPPTPPTDVEQIDQEDDILNETVVFNIRHQDDETHESETEDDVEYTEYHFVCEDSDNEQNDEAQLLRKKQLTGNQKRQQQRLRPVQINTITEQTPSVDQTQTQHQQALNKPLVYLGKTMSYLLRHGAESHKLRMHSDGFVPIEDILRYRDLSRFSHQDVRRVVEADTKQRFTIRYIRDHWSIRANQGHSIPTVTELELHEIKDASKLPFIVHGTRRSKLNLIAPIGIHRMSRNHIHLAVALTRPDGYHFNVRKHSDVLIQIDVAAAMREGIQFYVAANGVILTPGNSDGYIPHKFFQQIIPVGKLTTVPTIALTQKQEQTSNNDVHDSYYIPNSVLEAKVTEILQDTSDNVDDDSTTKTDTVNAITNEQDLLQPDKTLYEFQYEPLDMRKLQTECPELGPIIAYLETKALTDDLDVNKHIVAEAEYFFLKEDGVLYHIEPSKRKNFGRISPFVEQLAIPQSLRAEITKGCHNAYCHHGADRTFLVLKSRFYFRDAYHFVRGYVQNCEVCQKAKREIHYKKHILHPIPVNDLFTRYHLDILSLDCPDSQNRTHLLVIVEALSRYPWVFPLKTMTATEIAEIFFREIICQFGSPVSLYSDRGANLIGKVMTKLAELFQVKRLVTSSFRPESNGRCERLNSTILSSLRCARLEYPDKHWDELLPPILAALRGVISIDGSGFSAFEVMFGKPMRLPLENKLPPPDKGKTTVAAYVNNMLPRIELLRQLARENTKEKQEKFADKFNKKAMSRDFPVGSKVLLQKPCQTSGERKIGCHRTGPWLVCERLPDLTNNYVLRCCRTYKILKIPVHPSRLSYFYCDENNLYKPGALQEEEYEPPSDDMLQDQMPTQSATNRDHHASRQRAMTSQSDDEQNGTESTTSTYATCTNNACGYNIKHDIRTTAANRSETNTKQTTTRQNTTNTNSNSN